jgi:hypothetical protein
MGSVYSPQHVCRDTRMGGSGVVESQVRCLIVVEVGPNLYLVLTRPVHLIYSAIIRHSQLLSRISRPTLVINVKP